MFQDMYGDLPVMSTEVLALRKKLWDAEGYHLIYNVPRFAAGVKERGPVRPFAGLCIAYLVLCRKDKQQFCPQVGDRPKCYQIGWGNYSSGYGLFSLTFLYTDTWVGYRDVSHPGLSAGYYYCFFYFETDNTMHGFINNMDLRDDTAHPYNVSEASSTILFGEANWHEVETVEIHWVAWSSPHNRGGPPSQSLIDQVFPKYYYAEFSDVFEEGLGNYVGSPFSLRLDHSCKPIKRQLMLKQSPHVVGHRVKRLLYRISSSPGIFQMFIDGLLKNIPGVVPYFYDVFMIAPTQLELASRLREMLQRFKDADLRVKREVCVINVPEVNFLGYRVSAAGIFPTDPKVAAISEAPPPTNKLELQAFLGLRHFYHGF
ncbi:hypothetical protein MTO96_008761 [Rhipicephalus appendiculatus]